MHTNDTLFATIRPGLKRVAQVPGNLDGAIASTAFCVLKPQRHKVDSEFLFFVTSSDAFVEEVAEFQTGASYPAVREADVLSREIPFPALEEQRKIAAVLRLVRDSIRCEAELVSGAVALKRIAMRELFTRGLRGKEQKESEIGPIPETWDRHELGKIAEISYGAQAAVANATDPSIGTLILTNINILSDGEIDLDKKRYYQVPEAHRERLILRRGDVLFNWRSGSASHVGKTAYFDLDGEVTYSSFILRIRPHRCVSAKFLFRFLSHLRSQGYFVAQTNVSSINSVFNSSLTATIPVWFPDAEEQDEIVAILDGIDQKVQLHKRKRAVLEDLFKSLLHKLMTGEIRVSDLDLSALEQTPAAQVSA